jgi:GGDEF domain-containing protein
MLIFSIVIVSVAVALLLMKWYIGSSRPKRLSVALSSKVVNAAAFSDLVDKEIKRVGRSGAAFSLVYFEARGNDSHAGRMDEVLTAVAAVVLEHCREADFVARIDNGVAILMPNTAKEGLQAVLRKVRKELESITESEGWLSTFRTTAVVCDRNSLQVLPVKGSADAVISQLTRASADGLQGTQLPADGN